MHCAKNRLGPFGEQQHHTILHYAKYIVFPSQLVLTQCMENIWYELFVIRRKSEASVV